MDWSDHSSDKREQQIFLYNKPKYNNKTGRPYELLSVKKFVNGLLCFKICGANVYS